jgi:hypothetical protein
MGDEFFDKAPFDQISLITRYGEKTDLAPEYQRIVKSDGLRELPIAIVLNLSVLRKASPEDLHQIFRQAMLDALIAVAEKYGLRSERLQEERIFSITRGGRPGAHPLGDYPAARLSPACFVTLSPSTVI